MGRKRAWKGKRMEEEYVAGNPALNGSDRLVVVSGCSGGGKSTLLREMAARGYLVFPEPGRQIVKEQLYIGGDGLPWENALQFVELCLSRAMYFYNTARPGERPALFDRSIIDNVAGLQRIGYDLSPSLNEAVRRYRYGRRVYMTPPWPELFAQDSERRHTFEEAEAEYESLLVAYQVYGYEVVLLPQLAVGERADFLETKLGYG